ncbi:uncharacterized protein LOC116851588 [Odontomachus brunneus]|uniref:uncharacterized protein LOC116851588 n=1 Tax=Odontomachus brunneus TaxID=486640 RepID=UPI0013F1E9DF|nr:uncharacterized protein LOC116851588 [Odontomachus brunneus]
MVDYFVLHPYVATGKFTSLQGRANLEGSWEELVNQLNAMSKSGKEKDVASWKTTWRDNKTKVSEKASKLRAARAQTGNRPVENNLTELDKKILGIIGYAFAEGVDNSVDSFPEEQENINELLASGNTNILDKVPVILSCRSDNVYKMNNIQDSPTISGINTDRLGVQFAEARETFQAIEQQIAQTMDIL